MSKKAERDYLNNIGQNGIKHVIGKPFSDVYCGPVLAEIGEIISLLRNPPAKILDLGCGVGWTSRFLAKRGYNVTGLDISEDMIYHANKLKEKEGVNNLNFVVADFENLDFENEFDYVLFFDSFHHSENEINVMKSVYNSLKDNGLCIFSEPGLFHNKSPSARKAVSQFGVTEKDMHPKKIIDLGKKAGFKHFYVYPRFRLMLPILEKPISKNWFKRHAGKFRENLLLFFYIFIFKRITGLVILIK